MRRPRLQPQVRTACGRDQRAWRLWRTLNGSRQLSTFGLRLGLCGLSSMNPPWFAARQLGGAQTHAESKSLRAEKSALPGRTAGRAPTGADWTGEIEITTATDWRVPHLGVGGLARFREKLSLRPSSARLRGPRIRLRTPCPHIQAGRPAGRRHCRRMRGGGLSVSRHQSSAETHQRRHGSRARHPRSVDICTWPNGLFIVRLVGQQMTTLRWSYLGPCTSTRWKNHGPVPLLIEQQGL